MPQVTPKLGMTTYDLVNDGSVHFSTFRTTLAGYTNSALTKIDDFATQISADVNLLKSNPPIMRISAIKTDDFSYAVIGITEITAYNNGMYINLSLDNTNIGTVSLNINNLGAKGVYKIGADGFIANMSAGDLRKNKMNLFRYNGTAWVWVNAITSDQLNIVGTAGNLTKISSDNTLEDSGVTFATTATNNTIAQRTATGQIKGVAPSANDDLTNKQYVDTKAPLASPALTGTPTAPTATVGTNTTRIATTAFVNAEISNDRPYATTTTTLTNGGTGTVGTSSKVARENHTHTMPQSVLQSQVINDLTTGGETNVLSAQQGVELSSAIGQNTSDLNAHKAESVTRKVSNRLPNETDDVSKGFKQGDIWLYERYVNEQDYEYQVYQCIDNKKDIAKWVAYIEETGLDPNSWTGIQKIVRKGLASDFFTVGDQIMSNYDGGEIIWEVIGIDIDTPADPSLTHSMTIQTKDCLHNIQFDAPEPSNPDSNRTNYGNNRYVHSAVRQWLNSDEATFKWQSQHQYDVKPNANPELYNGAGFLNRLDPELVGVLGTVNKKVAKNAVTDGGGKEEFTDKVFLISPKEAGYTSSEMNDDGVYTGETVYPFYDGKGNANRVKNLDASPRSWWLRSPHVSNSSVVRCVFTCGTLYFHDASLSSGLSPACTIC